MVIVALPIHPRTYRLDRLRMALNLSLFFIGNSVPLLPLLKSFMIGRIDHDRPLGTGLTPHHVRGDDQWRRS
jgi:hypothetical protein